ncbi:MAG: hypothetical protein KGH85_05280 [Thaumarchaeota archaeon]|nr:hypothetical protein [Nitrososphaerota archaeon]
MFLQEEEFFNWAISNLEKLDEIIIISQTPIMFFKEEQMGIATTYLSALEKRFDLGHLRTTYFMPQNKLDSLISIKTPIDERIDIMRKWEMKWYDKINISALVVENGYFPLVSFWIGKNKNEIKYVLMKLNFEDSKKLKPIWLFVKEDVPKLDKLLLTLKDHSKTFSEYLDKQIDSISLLEP